MGVFERVVDGKLSVCKVTFGTEPKDYEVYDFDCHKYNSDFKRIRIINPSKIRENNPFKLSAEEFERYESALFIFIWQVVYRITCCICIMSNI